MKLVFVCKRSPQQRDLIGRPYGRFHHLPAGLAARGHQVTLLLVGHAGQPPARDRLDGVERIAFDLRRQGPIAVWRGLKEASAAAAPDWIIGCSDAWVGCVAHRLARRSGAGLAIDAYDNYESYMPWNLPLHALWRRAIRAADLVTAAGPQLAALMQGHRSGGTPAAVLPMAADPGFVPLEREQCRRELQLPASSPLVGYFGGWQGRRGTEVLEDALNRLRTRVPDARLVLTGRPPPGVARQDGVIALGYLPDAAMPVVLNAVDTACIIAADTRFGRFSYPSKLCEAMACRVPVVASATGPIRWMLGDDPRCLVPVADPTALATRLQAALQSDRLDYPPAPDWTALSAQFEALLSAR